ncbi:MAG: hypothetical protein KVP17_001319 [Porospora cf. gigantea B]|nr:MAG: hypothetical protein KVP17_001319 [Porospora cf. gigantea B]
MDLLGGPVEGRTEGACVEEAAQCAMVDDVLGRINVGVDTLTPNTSINMQVDEATEGLVEQVNEDLIDTAVNEVPEALIDKEIVEAFESLIDAAVDEVPEALIDMEIDEAPEALIDAAVEEVPEALINMEIDEAPEALIDAGVEEVPEALIVEIDEAPEALIDTAVKEVPESLIDAAAKLPEALVDMEIAASPEDLIDTAVEGVSEALTDIEIDEGLIDLEVDGVSESQMDVEISAGVNEVKSKTSPVVKEAVTSGLATDVDSSESDKSPSVTDSGTSMEGSCQSEATSESFNETPHQCNPRRRLRVSRLDYQDPLSSICQSEFRGFANLMPMMVALFVIAKMTANYYLTGYPVDTRLAYLMFKDFFWFMSLWGAIAAYSFLAYFAVGRLYSGTLQDSLLSVLKFLMNALLFGATATTCVLLNMPMMPAAFTLSTGCVHIMKIHSYVSMGQKHFRLKKAGYPSDPCFPSRLTPTNYLRFLVSPALVFEPCFPKSEAFRPVYFGNKLLVLLLDLVTMYVLCSAYIIPVADKSYSLTFVETFSQLMVPLACLVFVFFHFAFDTVCNCLAEITRYGDREFYSDWWNATTYDEFSRKWNRPVHDWLLTHIYLEVNQRYSIGKWAATATTFLLSAIMHEIFLAVLCRFLRGYMFSLMLLQIPLIALGRYHQATTFGNMFFWFGILIGVPLLMVCYTREWSARRHDGMDLYEPFRVF